VWHLEATVNENLKNHNPNTPLCSKTYQTVQEHSHDTPNSSHNREYRYRPVVGNGLSGLCTRAINDFCGRHFKRATRIQTMEHPNNEPKARVGEEWYDSDADEIITIIGVTGDGHQYVCESGEMTKKIRVSTFEDDRGFRFLDPSEAWE